MAEEIDTTGIIVPLADLTAEAGCASSLTNEEDVKAYSNNSRTHKTGITASQMITAYDQWADQYDEDLCPGRYNGPDIAADALAEYYFDNRVRSQLRILDVAAGTGRVGQALYDVGFRVIDALEPSEGMLEKAKGRKIYQNFISDLVGVHELDIKDGHYDCVVTAGGMGEGHIPTKAIDEFIRITKPGGVVCIVMREEYLFHVKEYVGKLEKRMKDLEASDVWKAISRKVVPNYSFNKNGVVFIYQVL